MREILDWFKALDIWTRVRYLGLLAFVVCVLLSLGLSSCQRAEPRRDDQGNQLEARIERVPPTTIQYTTLVASGYDLVRVVDVEYNVVCYWVTGSGTGVSCLSLDETERQHGY